MLRRTFVAALFARREAEQVDLWRQGDGGVHTYRIPALAETRKGTLLAVADARHEGTGDLPGRISLVMRTSRDKGRTWSAARTIREVKEGGVGDASLLVDQRSGRVWCFYAYGPPGIGFRTAKAGERTGAHTLQVHAMYSDDDGAHWSGGVDLTAQLKEPQWQAVFATSGTHFQLRSGRYLVPLVVRDERGAVTARNAYSDDAGKTWRTGPAIAADSDESKAVEIGGGVVLQNMRSEKERKRIVARSTDGGVTFGPAEMQLVDPRCNAGIASGKRDVLWFTNAASERRENLTVRASTDGGKTWSAGRVLHAGPAAYSTVLVLRDGSVAVLYERGEKHAVERITFARFEPEWGVGR